MSDRAEIWSVRGRNYSVIFTREPHNWRLRCPDLRLAFSAPRCNDARLALREKMLEKTRKSRAA